MKQMIKSAINYIICMIAMVYVAFGYAYIEQELQKEK